MTARGTTTPPTNAARPWRRPRFTDAEFDRMVRAGVFREGARAFLWAGAIVEPMTEDQPDLRIVARLFAHLIARFPEPGWAVNVNQPIRLRPGFPPQPDLGVLRGMDRSWAGSGRVPTPGDLALLVEVAASSLLDDSGVALDGVIRVDDLRVDVDRDPIAAEAGPLESEAIPARAILGVVLPD